MGEVRRAHDVVLGRDVAMKELLPPPGTDPAEATDRFLVEAQAAARLSHPNIVGVYDVFAEGERVLITMELVEGPTLDKLLHKTGPQPPGVVRAIMAQVAHALAAAHAAGVVHRDLKPDNVFWTAEGRAVVADFGLARIGPGRGTIEGTVMGTPGYMAPEQVRGLLAGPAADVFGWGAVAYELLTGDPPFGDPSYTDQSALAYRIVHEPPPPLDVPGDPALAALVDQALSKDPAERPADGAELVALLTSRPLRASEAHLAAPEPARHDSDVKNHWSRWPVLVAVPAVVAVLTVAMAISMGGTPKSEDIIAAPTSVTSTSSTEPARPAPTPFPEGADTISPGRHRTTRFQPGFEMTVDTTWNALTAQDRSYWSLVRPDRPESNIVTILVADRVFNKESAPSTIEEAKRAAEIAPADVAKWLATHRALSLLAPMAPVTVPGGMGVRFDMAVTAPYRYDGCVSGGEPLPCVLLFQTPVNDFLAGQGYLYRFYLFDVGSARVLVSVEAPEKEFAAFAVLADALIGTLRFTNP